MPAGAMYRAKTDCGRGLCRVQARLLAVPAEDRDSGIVQPAICDKQTQGQPAFVFLKCWQIPHNDCKTPRYVL